jgi:hypothetical protein
VLPPVKSRKPVAPTFSALVIVRVCATPPSVSSEVVPLLAPPKVSELMLLLTSRVTKSLPPE